MYNIEDRISLANSGNIDAIFNLGLMYQEGTEVPEDLLKATQWYIKGANLGDHNAMYIGFYIL